MSDLVYQVSLGNAKSLNGNNNVVCLDDANVMHLFVFGSVVRPNLNKSPLFKCRDMIANFRLSINHPKDRGHIKDAATGEAVLYVEDKIPRGKEKIVVSVDIALFDDVDKNDEDLRKLSSCFYNMISCEIKSIYGYEEDIAIYWSVDNGYFLFTGSSEDINASFHYNIEKGIVVLY